jgi:hypothetical protein
MFMLKADNTGITYRNHCQCKMYYYVVKMALYVL